MPTIVSWLYDFRGCHGIVTSVQPLRNEIELGAALRARREAAGLTQAQVAERARVSRAFVIDLERGRRPRAELGRALAVVRALEAAVVVVDHRAVSAEEALTHLLSEP